MEGDNEPQGTANDRATRIVANVCFSFILMLVMVSLWAMGQDGKGHASTDTQTTTQIVHNSAPSADDMLRKASETYKQGNVAEAISTLETSDQSHDTRVVQALHKYKHDGGPRLVAQARELYRQRRYESAVNSLTSAADFGNQEAARLLPDYQDHWNRAQRAEAEHERRLAVKEEEHERRLALKEEREKQNEYEGDGGVKIAVGGVKFQRSTELHTAAGHSIFVNVFISAKNFGEEMVAVNPNDFTLATQSGDTVSHDSDTYSMSNYFDAVELRPGQSTSGWLMFYLERDSRYTLSYQGFGGSAQKHLAP